MQFTIGIPVRNGERYLQQAIASAVAQKRPADEILVVDDASTDGSAQIALSPEWNNKVRYVYNDQPTGFTDAFNRVARFAQGDYVVILGCDDLLHEDLLLSAEHALTLYPQARHFYCGYNYIDENGILKSSSPLPHTSEPKLWLGKEYSQRYLRGVFEGQHIHRFLGFAIERELLLYECPIRKEAGLISDDDLFVRIGQFTDVVGVSRPLVSVRLHSESISASLDSLSRQLAEDYLFQVRCHSHGDTYLDDADINIYHQLAARFTWQFFVDALRSGKTEWITRSIDLKNEFERLAPSFKMVGAAWTRRCLWAAAHHKLMFPILVAAAKCRKQGAQVVKFLLRKAGLSIVKNTK